MRAVIQRVKQASVTVDGQIISSIKNGFMILLGVETRDTLEDVTYLCSKIAKLRVFDDDQGVMNLDITTINGEMLVVSQFTLHAMTRKGNRPSYIRAAPPEQAIQLYKQFVEILKNESGCPVYTGQFQAMMDVALINDGPVTIIIDSQEKDF
jgi:D-aminoacyl-tRNA deacylase